MYLPYTKDSGGSNLVGVPAVGANTFLISSVEIQLNLECVESAPTTTTSSSPSTTRTTTTSNCRDQSSTSFSSATSQHDLSCADLKDQGHCSHSDHGATIKKECPVSCGVCAGATRTQEETCASGVASGSVCCSSGCGTCGGTGCSGRSGGATACCSEHIVSFNRLCSQYGPPCVLTPGAYYYSDTANCGPDDSAYITTFAECEKAAKTLALVTDDTAQGACGSTADGANGCAGGPVGCYFTGSSDCTGSRCVLCIEQTVPPLARSRACTAERRALGACNASISLDPI